ncbi:glycosyltransferase family 1 protein [Acidipila sp. EB88]|uniref:glycosyltransferase family 4 protein n=1 Tax=Acidipila sp. EB88 TaxID=2305226 RepID=UPI00131556B1|nr:glycosyltransferase family 1 protein [Acidipila sp. EB88]
MTPPVTQTDRAEYVVNARFLAHRITGIQRYAREIASRLGGSPEMLKPSNGKGARGHLWEQLALPRLAGGRLLWSPCGAGPLSYTRQVVTFHDLFPLEHPEWYSAAYAKWYSLMFRRLATNAAHLIAVSSYTKDRLVRQLGCDPDDVTVVYNGPAQSTRLSTTFEAARACAALALPSRRYVLSLSSLEARKNLPTIFAAWRIAQRSLPDNVWLVLAGQQADASVFGKQQLSAIPARVHFTGYVAEEHLAGLYSGASLFLFPSLAEGFGLPLLEAMSCGLRAVTSNNSSLPEVGGDAAFYVDPLDVRELAAAILRHIASENAASAPFLPAMEQASRFCWTDSARRTEDVLQRAAHSRRKVAATDGRRWRVA